jgi:hypothetical protein
VPDPKDCFGQSTRNEGFVVYAGYVFMAAKASLDEASQQWYSVAVSNVG